MTDTAKHVTYEAEAYSGSAAENYERYFVPAIGAPIARDLIDVARLVAGERVLDVACGTGIVTRLAAEQVGDAGTVAGLDLNPGMLAVARATTAADQRITWHEASAEDMPLPDGCVDVVLCQMGLQFMADKVAALRQMRRVLAPTGRLVLNAPGPTPELFVVFADVLARHLAAEVATFVHAVFSLHDPDELGGLLADAGFADTTLQRHPKTLRLPPPVDFLWQYVHSTPLAAAVGQVDDDVRSAIEREIVEGWQPFMDNGGLTFEVDMLTAVAHRA